MEIGQSKRREREKRNALLTLQNYLANRHEQTGTCSQCGIVSIPSVTHIDLEGRRVDEEKLESEFMLGPGWFGSTTRTDESLGNQ